MKELIIPIVSFAVLLAVAGVGFYFIKRKSQGDSRRIISGPKKTVKTGNAETSKGDPSAKRRWIWRPWLPDFNTLLLLVLVGVVVYFWTRDLNWGDAPIDQADLVTTATDPSSKYQSISSFTTHHDKWVPVRNYMPNWFGKGDAKDKFSTGEYFAWMKIGENGTPFKYGPKNRRALTIEELKAAWILSIPNGDRRKGYAYFKRLK